MAANKKQETEKREMDVKFEGLGEYQEATGGGEPIPKGQKMTTQKRVMQPRDENGQFTYNAANKKPLKYGPSRGKTTPPYLRIKNTEIEEKEGERRVRKENIWDVTVKLSGYDKEQLIKDCREYVKGYKDKDHEEGFKYRTDLGDVTFTKKSGAKSRAEKAAIMSDYKGDVKDLKFSGDKEQLTSDWKEFKESGIKTSKYKGSLTKKEPGQIKPKAPKAPRFVKEDINLAKNDLEGFKKKYKNELGKISRMVDKSGVRVNLNKIIGLVGEGKLKSISEIENVVKRYIEKHKK